MNGATLNHEAAATGRGPTAAAPAAAVVTLDIALARLELSRSRLRDSFAPAPSPPAGSNRSFHPLRRARAWLRGTSWGGLLDPLLGTLGDELQRWWERQSWRQSAVIVKDAVSSEISPWVRRYPIAAVCITAAVGAALAGSGVWRWRTVRRSAAQLGTQLRRGLVSQLTSPTVQALLLAALASYLAPKPAGPGRTAPQADPPDPAAGARAEDAPRTAAQPQADFAARASSQPPHPAPASAS